MTMSVTAALAAAPTANQTDVSRKMDCCKKAGDDRPAAQHSEHH